MRPECSKQGKGNSKEEPGQLNLSTGSGKQSSTPADGVGSFNNCTNPWKPAATNDCSVAAVALQA
jgi:hypothetical protein